MGASGSELEPGNERFIVTGGVVNVHCTGFASAAPFIAFVLTGISTAYSVAIGKRFSGANISVFVPSQRHLPAGCGTRLTGRRSFSFARSSTVVIGTIGCENDIVRCGATSTGPSGA